MTETTTGLQTAQDILNQSLQQPSDAVITYAETELRQAFPDRTILSTEDRYFHPWHSTELWTVSSFSNHEFATYLKTGWSARHDKSVDGIYNGWLKVSWKESEILLLAIGQKGSYCREIHWFIVANSEAEARGYFEEVCRLHSTVKNEVLVFEEGYWDSDGELFESIQGTKLDELILQGELLEEIESDVKRFFEQRETFAKYNIPWKRGFIFLGPPGNGKTHMIKGLVNRFGLPCLYVKSLSGQHVSSQQCVSTVFERARETAPCLLIFEDLDTLLDDENRSFFLNEMDGFASNEGVVTIASCNFPDKLDAAILDRPSRFDRKYHFDLPEKLERKRYLERFMQRFEESLKLDQDGLEELAGKTNGYSFAYLKELYISSVIRWVSSEQHRPILDILIEQSEALREQMATAMNAIPVRPQKGHKRPRTPRMK